MYYDRRTHFTLSPADDLMDFLAGGCTKCLDLPGDAGAAGEQEGRRPMTDKYIQREEEILSFDVSDQALEAAAGSVREKAGAFTLAFCSGLDTCPSVRA
jgi:hypothetical protein